MASLNMKKSQFGIIGLGTMGRNFLLNVAEHDFSCVGYDLDAAKRKLLLEEGASWNLQTAEDLSGFVEKLEKPRKIMILVPAQAVDIVINDLINHLDKGDIVIDGGNSHFSDTERREKLLNDSGFEFLGVGISGGEEGARHGASIMIGGKREIYETVREIFEAASAKVGGEPCAAHVGKGSAGHFVKMVHNGIEYGLMQLIAETYDILKRGLEFEIDEIAGTFEDWNEGELNSFLMEITAKVLHKKDAETENYLAEMILDTAGQKGTGKWTSQAAMDFGIPVPTIDSAVTMRQISAMKGERLDASRILGTQVVPNEKLRELLSVVDLRRGLWAGFVITFAQGLSLLRAASLGKNYQVSLSQIARIWRGGCIIRAKILEKIRQAFAGNESLPNLLLDDYFAEKMKIRWADLLKIVITVSPTAIPVSSFAASLNYFNAYRTERLPANLIQAQRDFFGAHTYQRIDKEGIFHTPDW
jgi:6-phosphogluconate dehydrogenase